MAQELQEIEPIDRPPRRGSNLCPVLRFLGAFAANLVLATLALAAGGLALAAALHALDWLAV